MQETSALHKALLRDPRHRKEHRAVIAGAEYGQEAIVSLRTSGGIFAQPDIGNCASRQIDLTLRAPAGTIPGLRNRGIEPLCAIQSSVTPRWGHRSIPRQAKIQVFTRLTLGDQFAEWLPKGEFFISTRQRDKLTGALSLHGFDAMRRAGDVWQIDPAASWPMSEREAVEDIARRMGVEVDPRTRLSGRFPVDYPVDENGDLAMVDVLEGIAVSNAGNWVISDEGKLLLLGYGDLPPETSFLVDEYGDAITFGGVRILVG